MTQIRLIDRSRDLSTRQKVLALEAEMKHRPQLDLPINHHFAPGLYARELFIPKGTLLTGKIHKTEHLNVMAAGEMSVLVGDEIRRVKAPFVVVSKPGTKRIALAHEDSVWITFHPTDETDVPSLERLLVCDTDEEYLEHMAELRRLEACRS